MFHIIGVLFFIGIFILFIGLILASKLISSLATLIRSIFHPFQQNKDNQSDHVSRGHSNQKSNNADQQKKHTGGNKIFDENDGEYIDFEEIKD